MAAAVGQRAGHLSRRRAQTRPRPAVFGAGQCGQADRHRRRDEGHHRRGAGVRRRRLHPRLPRRALHARGQDHPDLRGHQPDSAAGHRAGADGDTSRFGRRGHRDPWCRCRSAIRCPSRRPSRRTSPAREPSPMCPSATDWPTMAGSKPRPSSATVSVSRSPVALQPHVHRRRTGVLAHVGEQLARGPVQQQLGIRLTHLLEVGVDGDLGASLELLQHFSQRGRESELGEHLRMQLGDGRAQARRGFLQRLIDHVERGIGVPLTRLVEFQACGEQRLQRAVVQMLGHLAVAPLVGLHRLGNQLAPHLLQRRDPQCPSRRARSTARSSRRPARAGSRSACTPCSASRPCRRAWNRRSTRRDSRPP